MAIQRVEITETKDCRGLLGQHIEKRLSAIYSLATMLGLRFCRPVFSAIRKPVSMSFRIVVLQFGECGQSVQKLTGRNME